MNFTASTLKLTAISKSKVPWSHIGKAKLQGNNLCEEMICNSYINFSNMKQKHKKESFGLCTLQLAIWQTITVCGCTHKNSTRESLSIKTFYSEVIFYVFICFLPHYNMNTKNFRFKKLFQASCNLKHVGYLRYNQHLFQIILSSILFSAVSCWCFALQ